MPLADSVESALHLCVLLGSAPGGSMAASDLADAHGLAPAATAKLLQQLAGAGLVEAHRGRTGGYSLGRPAERITIADIVEATGPDQGFRCREIRRLGACAVPRGTYSPRCAIAQAMDAADAAWRAALRALTVADLVTSVAQQLDPTVRTKVEGWMRQKVRSAK